jgi:ketosteroid isomerase-like protein
MSNTDIVKAGMAAWCSGDWATLSALAADDFTLIGVTPQPLDKNAFIGLGHALVSAFPDWNFNADNFSENGDQVSLKTRITGTHTGTLAAIPGVPPVPATGKHVETGQEIQTYTLRDGKISQLNIQIEPGGGVAGMYAQVGAPLG